MSLVPMSEILVPARRGGYAIGAFEVWNLESVQAVVAAAEGLSQPVILQIGPYEADHAGLEDIAHIAVFHARRAKISVAIGTVHGFYKGEPNIRLGLLEEIAERVPIPLVLHGGSGTLDTDVRKVISFGIAKVNICTELVAAFADTFVSEQDFRYNVPGVFTRPRAAAKKLVEQKIRLFAGL